jgi:hypothetical protein
VTFTGAVTVTHSDQGLQANGADCGFGTPDNTSPFDDHYMVSLQWSTSFTFRLMRRRISARARAAINGGQFSYSGYTYDFNCNEIAYGPSGQPCTGALTVADPATLTVHASPARRPKRLTVTAQPFGTPAATPATCTVQTTPQVTYTAADELELASLGRQLARQFRLAVPKRPRTFTYKLARTIDCSQPPQSAGESDTCKTTFTGTGSLRIRPA